MPAVRAAREREQRHAGARERGRGGPARRRAPAVQRPLERAGQRGRRAERDDRADGDARVVDRREERRLVGGHARRRRPAPARAPTPGRTRSAPHEQREQHEQRAAAGDPRRADRRRVDAVGAERLRGARGPEAEGGEEDLETCHRGIVPQFHNQQAAGNARQTAAPWISDSPARPRSSRAPRAGSARPSRASWPPRAPASRCTTTATARPPRRSPPSSAASRSRPTCATRRRPTRSCPAAVEALGRLDACVANAGVWPSEDVPVARLGLDRWRATIDANLTATFLTARAFLRHVESAGARQPGADRLHRRAVRRGRATPTTPPPRPRSPTGSPSRSRTRSCARRRRRA